jgi:hypothetical protein
MSARQIGKMARRVKRSLAVAMPESWQQSRDMAAKALFCNIFLGNHPTLRHI